MAYLFQVSSKLVKVHPLVDSRGEDSKSMNSDADFFSKIGGLWIQVIDLVIVRITTTIIYVTCVVSNT
ncbi:unnamed protein product [Spirodela intermedia]|uniref:Uncharacterized protein n=1 Tax=Spirodela intermedia TaxID=51605 RepID=A0ABN7EBA4_SPIIN|nr:unnamed protein product [Spirodela intermedia]